MKILKWLGLSLGLVLVLVACTSDPNAVVAGDDTTDAVADVSAPTEVAQSFDQAPEGIAAFFPYLEPSFDPLRPGRARFVLLDDDGQVATPGPPGFPAYAMDVTVWAGVSEPFVMTVGFGNFSLDGQQRLFAPDCSYVWGEFDPQVDDLSLIHI